MIALYYPGAARVEHKCHLACVLGRQTAWENWSQVPFTIRQSVGRKPLRVPEEVRGGWTTKCQGSWKTKMVWCQKEAGTDCSDFDTRGHAKDPQFSICTEANSQRCKWMRKLSKLSETVTAQFGIHVPSDEATVHLLWARQCYRQGATALRKKNSTYPHKARILVKTTVCFSWWTINKEVRYLSAMSKILWKKIKNGMDLGNVCHKRGAAI